MTRRVRARRAIRSRRILAQLWRGSLVSPAANTLTLRPPLMQTYIGFANRDHDQVDVDDDDDDDNERNQGNLRFPHKSLGKRHEISPKRQENNAFQSKSQENRPHENKAHPQKKSKNNSPLQTPPSFFSCRAWLAAKNIAPSRRIALIT